MGQPQERIGWFLQRATEFAPDWESLDLRFIAERGRKGDWVPVHLRCVFSTATVQEPRHPDLPATAEVRAMHERLPVMELHRVVKGVGSGRLTILGEEFSFLREGNADPLPSLYPRTLDLPSAQGWLGIDGAAILLHTSDSTSMRLQDADLRTADASLQGLDHPWEGLEDLRRNFIGTAAGSSRHHDYATYEFIVPIGARFRPMPTLDGRILPVSLEVAAGLDLSRTRLACIAHYAEGPPSRGQIEIRRDPENAELARGTVEFKRTPRFLNLSLTHRGHAADKTEIFGTAINDVSQRLATLEWVPGGMNGLLNRMGTSRDPDHFASDLGLLLSFAGFAVSVPASGDWPTPDIVAWPAGRGAVLVVECTLRELDVNGKLSRLSTRSKELAQRTGRETLAVIATALERTVVAATDLEKARRESIAVLSRDSLNALAELAVRGASEDEVEGWIRKQVPAGPLGPN